MTAYQHRELVALDQIEDLLEAYADARLAPASPVLARMRANVMTSARAAAASQAVDAALAGIDTDRRRRWQLPTFAVPRRAFALGMAAALTLGTSAAVLAAPPGSPFYNARVAIEAAFLPTQVDDRMAAHERHLEDRLAAAEAAAARGDVVALEAALVAYQSEVDAATLDAGDDLDRLAHLEEMLAKHTAVLTALSATLPDESSIDKAIENSGKAIQKIKDKEGHGRPSHLPAGPPDDAGGQGAGQQR